MFRINESGSNNFDFLRLSMAVLVIFSHSFILGSGSYRAEPIYVISRGFSTGGGLAVDTFFIISGYLVTASFMRSKSLWSYLKKRVLRIYPGFIGVSIFNLLVVVPLSLGVLKGSNTFHRAIFVVLKMCTLAGVVCLHSFTKNAVSGIDGSLWTIRYEFACYLCLAGLGLLGVLRSRRACALLFVPLWIASIVVEFMFPASSAAEGAIQYGSYMRDVMIHSAHFAPIYMAGVLAYLYRDKFRFRPSWALISLAVLLVANALPAGMAVAYPLAGMYLVFFLAYLPTEHLAMAGRFGDFSYGTYLYAFPIQQLIIQHFGGQVNPIVLFLLATPPTLLAAFLSWHLIESRFLPKSRMRRAEKRVESLVIS